MALTAYGLECAFAVGFQACTTSFLVVHSIAGDVCTSRVAQIQPGRLGFTELRDCSFVGISVAWTTEILKLLVLRNSWRGRFGAYYCRVTIISAKP
jgi:hypothetical protein